MQPHDQLVQYEKAQSEALAALNILYTDQENVYDEVAELAAQICGTPMGMSMFTFNFVTLVNFVDFEKSQVFAKASFGIPVCAAPMGDKLSNFCVCCTRTPQTQVLHVPNALLDKDFCKNVFVMNAPCLRFYCGAPLALPNGISVGTLCVLDTKERELSQTQMNALLKLRNQVVSQLVLRMKNDELAKLTLKLHESNDKLTSVHNNKSQWLRIVSHDLRQPVSFICAASEYILQGDQMEKNLIQDIHSSSSFMSGMLHQLVHAVRNMDKNEHNAPFQFQTVQLHQINHPIVRRHGLVAKPKGIQVLYQCSEDAIEAKCNIDVNGYEQIMNNLISNAIKYSPKNEIVNVVVQKEKNELVVHTIDNGAGLSEEQIGKLFAPYQTPNKPTAGESSIGLGLFLTKTMIDAQRGRISVKSNIGSGSTFSLYLPLVQENQLESTNNLVKKIDEPACKPKDAPYRILIVDDNPMQQKILAKVLQTNGYDTCCAIHGKQALDILQQQSCDLVILDEQMPVMTGSQFLHHMEQNQLYPSLPIIRVTGDDSLEKVERARVIATLFKPVQMKNILEIVNKVFA